MDTSTVDAKADPEKVELKDPSFASQTTSPAELAAMRDMIVKAHPDVVPGLITGSTFAELTASLPAAQQAYADIAARIAPPAAQPPPPVVPPASPPIGSGLFVDVAKLPPSELIKRGIEARQKQR